jgi:hypothetical protein
MPVMRVQLVIVGPADHVAVVPFAGADLAMLAIELVELVHGDLHEVVID